MSLVVGHIGQRTNVDWLMRRVLPESSATHGFSYFDVPELAGPTHRLPRDGHYSEEEHRRLAEALAGYLDDRGLL